MNRERGTPESLHAESRARPANADRMQRLAPPHGPGGRTGEAGVVERQDCAARIPSMASTSPELLCHPAEVAVVRGFRGACPVCGSFWDLEACKRVAEYTDAYPHERNHFDPRVGALKVSTMSAGWTVWS